MAVVGSRWEIPLDGMRVAGAAMIAAAAALPLLPGGIGIPCPLRSLTGIPCPLCGMTTSVVATADLRLGDALAANPAGVLAVVMALVLLVAGRRRRLSLPVWLAVALPAAMWVFQLQRYSVI